MVPADQNDLPSERKIVEDCVGHLLDFCVVVLIAVIDMKIQTGPQRSNRLDGAIALPRLLRGEDEIRNGKPRGLSF